MKAVADLAAMHANHTHEVARPQLPPMHLDDEIGAASEKPAVVAEPCAEGDGLCERGQLVVFEAHACLRGARGRPLSVRTRTPRPKSRAVTSCGHTAASSAAARFSRGAIRCSLCTGTRNVGPDTATDPTTPSPRMTGAATARPPATSSSSTIA